MSYPELQCCTMFQTSSIVANSTIRKHCIMITNDAKYGRNKHVEYYLSNSDTKVLLDDFFEAADENLNEQQRKNLYGTLSVAKASTLLWAPRALGGEGLYEDIHGQGFNKSAGWDWDKATKADIGTSAGFWLTNSVLITIGMTNVATGTGILTAWAISTAVGSLLGGAAAGTPTGG